MKAAKKYLCEVRGSVLAENKGYFSLFQTRCGTCDKKCNFQTFFLISKIQLQPICDDTNGVIKFTVSPTQLMWSGTL